MSTSITANEHLTKLLAAFGLADTNVGKLIGGALIDPTSTAAGTTQSTEYAVNSVTLPKDFLGQVKRGLLILAGGVTAANANAKNLKLSFGATDVASVAGSTASGKNYLLGALVLRTGVDTQVAFGFSIVDSTVACYKTGPTEDDGGTITIQQSLENTAAAATAGTGYGLAAILLG
jgi:hypothetical protein